MAVSSTPCPEPDCDGVLGYEGFCTQCGGSGDDDRRPCPDGACIGIIAPDGHCSECGVFAGVAEDGDEHDEDQDDEVLRGFEDDQEEDEDDEDIGYRDDDDDDDDDEERLPCPDGACIGIIDADGHCSECGRQADEDPPGAS